ncbi:nucleotidyltransferase domain-containing protein [Candidatus Halobeggiatoa sp. HSG11]|nr:nucleotidyltransferase domain-containing protein [Candidatus Halobeggiatoa sp. HSG11]
MNVRLNQEYLNFICHKSLELFNSKEVWIFGSRADMNQKGGDIDIYIKTPNTNNILQTKIIFLREFEKKFGEQKVDLIIEAANSKSNKIFEIAKQEGVKIYATTDKT